MYEIKEISLKDLEEKIKMYIPVFGELTSTITKKEKGNKIVFVDKDEANVVICSKQIKKN